MVNTAEEEEEEESFELVDNNTITDAVLYELAVVTLCQHNNEPPLRKLQRIILDVHYVQVSRTLEMCFEVLRIFVRSFYTLRIRKQLP